MRYQRRLAQMIIAWGLLSLVVTTSAMAKSITFNLKDADLSSVITTVSQLTGKNFIVDPRVKGKATIISSHPMDKDEVYQVFLTILQVHGFAAIPSGNAIKIIPSASAKQSAGVMASARRPGRGDEVVTRVLQLENVSAPQLVPILRPLMPQQGHMAAYAPANVLIISDRAANITRLIQVIHRIDQPSSDEVEVIPLKHASASEVVRILTTLAQQANKGAKGNASVPPILIADERTNSVLIGGAKAGRLRLRSIIAHLDTPLETSGNTQVIFLRYAKAKDLVPVLTGIGKSMEQEKRSIKGKGAKAGSTPINIQAVEPSNSIVITAPPDQIHALKQVIQQLDVRRAQVLVEGVIAEVTSSRTAELGVQWVLDGLPSDNPVGIVNFNVGGSGSSIGEIGAAIASGTASAAAPGVTVGFGQFNSGSFNFGALVRALEGDGSSNVLSKPTLITLDNEEAEIVVGQKVPFLTGSFTSTGSGTSATNPFQTINRENVGITLKVKPQINEGNAVRLDIEQTIDSISPSSVAVDTITNTRSIKTSVMVDDGKIVVLGGMLTDDLAENSQKVPLLGDIPLIGRLFRYDRSTKRKTNLLVFIHPVIMREGTLTTRISGNKYDYIRDKQLEIKNAGISLLPDDEAPLLSPLDHFLELPPPFEGSDSAAGIDADEKR
ncbi:MAG: type II secretion system secretin GspD [Gammaproteobacteria bacterium]|nr:type II secretion system secretin GspD [Gammaproteobacteria bacterium]